MKITVMTTTPVQIHLLTGFDENRTEDVHSYCFTSKEDARAFLKAANELPYSEHITWRFESLAAEPSLEQALFNLRRDLTTERQENGYDGLEITEEM